LPGGIGCIIENPDFVDLVLNDYHLLAGSPCIDTGTNMAWMDPPATDLDGNPRVQDGTVDMGCYEFVPEPCCLLLVIFQLFFIIYCQRFN